MKAYIVASYAHRNQTRQSGEPYILHPIAVTTILAETLHMDLDTLAAGLLHDVAEDTDFDIDYIREHFNEDIANLVDGVTKLKRINELSNAQRAAWPTPKPNHCARCSWPWSKMFRVVIIKLADRLHNMRTLGRSAQAQAQTNCARDARYLCAVGQPAGHLADQVGVGRSQLSLCGARKPIANWPRAMQQKRSEREKWWSHRSDVSLKRRWQRRHPRRDQRSAQTHLQHLAQDAAQGR